MGFNTSITSCSQGEEETSSHGHLLQGSVPSTPTRPAATSTVVDGEERGDIIAFYNKIFMEKLQVSNPVKMSLCSFKI